MISLLVPTRGRPDRFAAMLSSARATASAPFEVCAWLDDDDPSAYPDDPTIRYGRGPRRYVDGVLTTSGLWSDAWELATGDIAMMAADDITFRTRGWDARVEEAFSAVPDRILLVYPHDGTRRAAPVNPFISRRWIEAAGGYTPPDFQGWFADEWLWTIAAELRRVVYLRRVRIIHHQGRNDPTYRDGRAARAAVGGIGAMRDRFCSAPVAARRGAQIERLRGVMSPMPDMVPTPEPEWFTTAVERGRHDAGVSQPEDTLVVVHCYAGDAELVEAFLPQYLHHGCPVLVLSPTDAPVHIQHPRVECRSAGRAAYFGEASLERQRLHLQLLLEYPHRFFLLNDADSMCLSPEIPAYLYKRPGTVWSNEVRETRPHTSPYEKIAFHPPYFLDRSSIERMLAVGGGIQTHPITPFIDWYMVAMAHEAGLEHRSFPDGRSFPAWRHGAIPETKELGHNYVHTPTAHGVDGARRMQQQVRRGVVMVHSIKHPPVRDMLVEAHAAFRAARPRRRSA